MNHALQLLDLNYRYLAFAVRERDVGQAVQSIRALNFRGTNVTIPHKQFVMQHLDHVHDAAGNIGAVNCILNDNGVLTGYNTDRTGFVKPIKDRGIDIAGRRALIIGAGGAARAVVSGLVEQGTASVLILNRTERNGKDITGWCSGKLHFKDIGYGGPPSKLEQHVLDSFDLIVNTTPVGMHPEIAASPLPAELNFHHDQVVYDLIYNPAESRLLSHAAAGDAVTINGFEMLIIQGLYSLAIWFPQHEDQIFSLQDRIVTYTRRTVSGK
jgi:shikimate dehydrogenase